jgi:hypothetical protein
MQTPTPPRPSEGRRTRPGLIAAGLLTAVIALGAVVGGGAALWANEQQDAQGYVSTDGHRLSTGSAALVSENLDIDLDGANWLFDDRGALGDVKVAAEPEHGESVFVGIARTADVQRYLGGVARATVTDVGWGMFDGDPAYRSETGERRAAPPGEQAFWVASAQGAGKQALTWDMRDGDWSLVVMNANGSPHVAAGLAVGMKVPWLNEAGWAALGGGLLVSLGAAALLLAGFRRPRDGAPGTARTAPAAA